MESLNGRTQKMCVIYIRFHHANKPTSQPAYYLEGKQVHKFSILYWIWLTLGVKTPNLKLKALRMIHFGFLNFLLKQSFGQSNLVEFVIFNPLPLLTHLLFKFFFSYPRGTNPT